MNRLLIKHAHQIVQVCSNREKMLCGEQARNIVVLECKDDYPNGGLSVAVGPDGKIKAIGTDNDVQKQTEGEEFVKIYDATGKCILPGLIDGHTHPVWVGDRVHEFAAKLAGATYMDIHKMGGGIHFTVNHVREASESELYESFLKRLKSMSKCGTTTLEAKSGYGLDTESEIKMLRVIDRARKQFQAIDISSTYCGAHAIPKGQTMEQATDDVINNQLPAIKSLMDKGELHVDNIDVFCENGVFDTDASRRILEAGKAHGLAINFHGDELHPMKSGELGALLDARAISHLEEVSENGIQAMADKAVVAVLLPTTAYILKLKPPPARAMIEKGVPVALGSDFNPNAHCFSMPLVMHMACCILRMSMEEALVGATINAAASIGLSETHGSLEVDKYADMVLIHAPKWEHLIYQLGAQNDLITHVIKNGDVVYTRPN